MQELISTFHIDTSLLVAQVVNFAIVFFVLYKMAIKPLRKIMTERHKEITKGLDDAKQNEALLKSTKDDYDNALKEAHKKAHEIVESAKVSINSERDEILSSARKDAMKIVVDGKAQLSLEKEKMVRDAKNELADLVVSATEKVLEGVVTGPINKKLIEDALKK